MQKDKNNFWYMAAGTLCVLLFLLSCGNKAKQYIIPEKKFIAVLVDLHIAESIGVQYIRDVDMKYQIDSASLYGSVFKKHYVTRAMFDSTLLFYCSRPEKFQKLYNVVTAQLKHMEEKVTEEEKQVEMATTQTLYKSDSVYVFPKDGPNRISIDIPIHEPGIYMVSADVKLLPDDMALDPRMSVYFFKEDSIVGEKRLNFMEIRYTNRTGEERTYKAVKRIIDSSYTNIRGYIANYSNVDSNFRRNMVVRNILVTRKDMEKDKVPRPGAVE
jgi:hypothetical protein